MAWHGMVWQPTIGGGGVGRTEVGIEVRARDMLGLRRGARDLRPTYSRVEQTKVFCPVSYTSPRAIITILHSHRTTKGITFTVRIGQV